MNFDFESEDNRLKALLCIYFDARSFHIRVKSSFDILFGELGIPTKLELGGAFEYFLIAKGAKYMGRAKLF